MKAVPRSRGFVLMMVVVALFLLAAIALMLSRESSVAIDLNRSIQQQDVAGYAAESGLQHAQWAANATNCGTYTNIATTPVGTANSATYSASYSALTGSPVEVTATGSSTAGASTTKRRLIKSYSAPIQNTTAATQDSFIEQKAQNQNFGATPDMKVSSVPAELGYGVLELAVPTASSHQRLISAHLTLHQEGGDIDPSPVTASVYPITSAWTENAVNWVNASSGVAWTTSGGDIAPNPQLSLPFDATVAGTVEWDITELAKTWLQGNPNNGVLVKLATGNRRVTFNSSDHPDSTVHPQLTLQMSCECGYSCALAEQGCSADYIPKDTRLTFNAGAIGDKKLTGATFVPAGALFGGLTMPPGGAIVYISEATKSLTAFDSSGAHITTVGPLALERPSALTWVGSGPQAQNVLIAEESLGAVLVYNPSGVNIASIKAPRGFAVVSGISHISEPASAAYKDALLLAGDAPVLGISMPAVHIYNQSLRRLEATIPLPLGTGLPSGAAHLPGTDKFLLATPGSRQVLMLNFSGQLLGAYNTESFSAKEVAGLSVNTENCDHLLTDLASHSLLALYPGQPCTLKYGDDFESGTYDGSTGSSNWASTPWLEYGENDGPAAGDVRLLTMDGETGLAVSGSSGAMRALDLTGDIKVILSLDARALSIEGGENVTIEISRDGLAGPWDSLHEIGGPTADQKSSASLDISAYASADTAIRLRPSATLDSGDTVIIDNLRIQVCD